jgi:hypothetical protein
MGKKIDESKKEFAFLLYMSGELQKNICDRVPIDAKTLQKYIEKERWGQRRAASHVTRSELVNKILLSVSRVLDKHLNDEDDDQNISDQLVKFAKTIETLDKKASVVDDMEVFTGYNTWLQNRVHIDKELSPEFVKKNNRYQDLYISERISQQHG